VFFVQRAGVRLLFLSCVMEQKGGGFQYGVSAAANSSVSGLVEGCKRDVELLAGLGRSAWDGEEGGGKGLL